MTDDQFGPTGRTRTVQARYAQVTTEVDYNLVDGGYDVRLNADAEKLPGKLTALTAAQARELARNLLAQADEADRRDGTENKSEFMGYTTGQLSAAFALVKPAGNWKLAIDAVVPAGTDTRAIDAACIFYAGSPADITEVRGGYRVRAAGYYACIGS